MVSGTVVSKKTVRLPGEKQKNQNMVVMIKTKKGNDRLIVDLGNARNLNNMKIGKDTNLEVQGRMAKVGRHEILVAKQLKVNGASVKVDRSAEKKAFEQAKKRGQG